MLRSWTSARDAFREHTICIIHIVYIYACSGCTDLVIDRVLHAISIRSLYAVIPLLVAKHVQSTLHTGL